MVWTLPQALVALGRFVSLREGPAGKETSGPGAHGHTSLDEDEGIIELIGEPFWPEGQGCGITFPGGYVSWSRDFERLPGC